MKKSLDTRTGVAYAILALIGVFLLLLGSASLNVSYNFMGPIIVIFSILPLFLTFAIAIIAINKGNKNKTNTARNEKLEKIFSILIICGFLAGLIATKLSTLDIAYNQTGIRFVLENVGTGGIFIGFLFSCMLTDLQKYVYWPLWGKLDRSHADERQLFVRQRVFEKSYRYMIFLVIAGVLVVGFQADRMQKVAPYLIGLSAFSLPSIIAAWQKDS